MGFVINLSKSFYVNMRITLGGTYAGVAEKFLYYPDIAAGIYEVCGKAVPEGMGMYVLSQPRPFSVL